MPCWRMSDEVSVFHPSPFWCRTRSPLGRFLSPCHAADLAPTAEVRTSTDPSRYPLPPHIPLPPAADLSDASGTIYRKLVPAGGICVWIPLSGSTCFAESASAYNTIQSGKDEISCKKKPSLGRNILSFMTSQNINADHYAQCIQRVARY